MLNKITLGVILLISSLFLSVYLFNHINPYSAFIFLALSIYLSINYINKQIKNKSKKNENN